MNRWLRGPGRDRSGRLARGVRVGGGGLRGRRTSAFPLHTRRGELTPFGVRTGSGRSLNFQILASRIELIVLRALFVGRQTAGCLNPHWFPLPPLPPLKTFHRREPAFRHAACDRSPAAMPRRPPSPAAADDFPPEQASRVAV